jgi:hypothetical protein
MPRAFEVPLDIVMNKTWDKKLIYEFVYDSWSCNFLVHFIFVGSPWFLLSIQYKLVKISVLIYEDKLLILTVFAHVAYSLRMREMLCLLSSVRPLPLFCFTIYIFLVHEHIPFILCNG